jgi:hypothetical protein
MRLASCKPSCSDLAWLGGVRNLCRRPDGHTGQQLYQGEQTGRDRVASRRSDSPVARPMGVIVLRCGTPYVHEAVAIVWLVCSRLWRARSRGAPGFGAGMACPACGQRGSLLNTNAARKPRTVISPVISWPCSTASGIMVSASMAKIAPAATATVAAMTKGEKPRNAT